MTGDVRFGISWVERVSEMGTAVLLYYMGAERHCPRAGQGCGEVEDNRWRHPDQVDKGNTIC